MARGRKWLQTTLLVLSGGCATTGPQKVTPAVEAEQTINTLRAQNSGYIRQIEELQNRLFILEDRLDSQRVVGQRRATPVLPVSRTLREDPPEYEVVESVPATPRFDDGSQTASLDSIVEYSGEAARPPRARPVLRLQRTPARARITARDDRPPARQPISAPSSPAAPAPRATRPPRETPERSTPPRFAASTSSTPASPSPQASPAPVAAAPAVPSSPPRSVATPSAPVSSAPAPSPPSSVSASAVSAALSRDSAPRAAPPAPSIPELATREDSQPQEPIPAEPLRLYRSALMALRSGNHGPALAAFRSFLARYPAHDYADNAQYWIAECYYDLKEYQSATREFRRVIQQYPRGNKVPDAMLKLGFTHLALSQSLEGRQVLESLLRAYPRHASAALASTRLAELPRTGKSEVNLGTIAPRLGSPAPRRSSGTP